MKVDPVWNITWFSVISIVLVVVVVSTIVEGSTIISTLVLSVVVSTTKVLVWVEMSRSLEFQ